MKKKLCALIVGCGYLGSYLKNFLILNGLNVRCIRRKIENGSEDLSIDVSAEFELNEDYDLIFYMVSAQSYNEESYQLAYVTGVENTLKAIKNSGIRPKFYFISSTSVFSQKDGDFVDEDSPVSQNSFSSKALLKGEELVASSNLDYTVLRLSGIYGPGRMRLVEQIKAGAIFLKKNPFISNRIHVDDCVQAMYHLVKLENHEKIYIFSDSAPTPYNEVIEWTTNKLGIKNISYELQATHSAHMSNKKCSNKRLIKSGYSFKYSTYQEGFISCL